MLDLMAIVPYYTAYLSRALKSEGVDVRVASISYYLDLGCFSSRGLRPEAGLLDIVGRLPKLPAVVRRAAKLVETAVNMMALALQILFQPPAVIHVQYLPLLRWGIPFERWLLALCRHNAVPVILTVHDLLPHDTGDNYRETFARIYRKADAIICHSEHVRLRLIKEFAIPASRIHVVPHGPFFYDLLPGKADFEPSGSEDEVHVLCQGILFPYKGVDVLLEAWKHVEEQALTARLCVLGTGSPEMQTQLRMQVEALSLKHVMLDLRFVSASELVAAYLAADLVVYPYRAISTSGALATGLALGKAIIASDLPVFRETLRDGENALLCPANDSAQLAHTLIRAIESSDLREELAFAVRAMRFGDESWRKIARQTVEAYEAASLKAQRGDAHHEQGS